MPPTVIPFNPRRWIAILLGSVCFVAVCVVLLILHRDVKTVAASAVGVLFFGLGTWVATQRMLRREPELIISGEGIKTPQAALVSWGDVERVGIRTMTTRGAPKKMIEVVLRDPAAYIARSRGFTALAARANKSAGYSPVTIAAVSSSHPLSAILSAMQAHNPGLPLSSSVELLDKSAATTGGIWKKRLLKWAGIAVLGFVFFLGIVAWKNLTGDLSTAEVGDCISMNGDDGATAKVVDCANSDARYKIMGQFAAKTEAQNDSESPCDVFPDSQVQFWYGKKDEHGVIWCFGPPK